ncbi:unnamed protein product [Amaranthus hypochondriacus]
MLKRPLHKSIHEIATKYGQVLLLKLGVRNVLLVSSPEAVEECLVKNDVIFADRPDTLVGRILHYNRTSMALTPYNDHFRTIKRLMTQQVFTSGKIRLFTSVREEECQLLVRGLWEQSIDNHKPVKVNLNKEFNDLGLNIMTQITAAKRFYGKGVEDASQAKQFSRIIREGALLSNADNPIDFIPIMKYLYRGVEKQMISWMERTDIFYQRLLDERKRMTNDEKGDFRTIIDFLIEAQQQDPVFYTNEVIKGMVMIIILAGADTSAAAMEWAMALLLNHPEAMKKARAEIDSVIGHDRLIKEEDISQLPYLQNVVNESLRLYPPTPLLIPHESSQDCTICGYDIPRGTILMVSLWTIHHDPNLWDEPEKFKPERFEGQEGENVVFRSLPFGLGRRACPGYAIGKRVICLAIGAFIQCFDWERPGNELLDMDQDAGITMPKAQQLEALYKIRPSMANLLGTLFNDDN